MQTIPSREQLAEAFHGLPSVSVDYGIMEKTDRIKVIPTDIGWDDVGNWTSIAAHLSGSGENKCVGDGTLIETQGYLAYGDSGPLLIRAKES